MISRKMFLFFMRLLKYLCSFIKQLLCISGTTVANMARIFSLRYDERPGRKFKLLSQTLVTGRPNKSKRAVHLVDLDEKSGIMTLNKILDREELCGSSNECTLQVQVEKIFKFKLLTRINFHV